MSKQDQQDEVYDRAQRRVADNAHGNQATPDTYDLADDDVARAVYPDPKARHLNQNTDLLAAKRELRAADDKVNADQADADQRADGENVKVNAQAAKGSGTAKK